MEDSAPEQYASNEGAMEAAESRRSATIAIMALKIAVPKQSVTRSYFGIQVILESLSSASKVSLAV